MTIHWLETERILPPLHYYTLVTTERQFRKAMKHLGIAYPPPWVNVGSEATTHFLEAGNRQAAVVAIRLARPRMLSEVVGLLAHEAVHIAQEYFADIGERLPSPEFQAYVTKWITSELVLAYDKRRFGRVVSP